MLVHFSSKHSADFLLLGSHAHAIFDAMGKPLTARGVIDAQHAAAVLGALELHLNTVATNPSTAPVQADDDAAASVGLAQRAWPLREMLKTSAAKGGDILWETGAT